MVEYVVAEVVDEKIWKVWYQVSDLDVAKAHARSLKTLCKNQIIVVKSALEE